MEHQIEIDKYAPPLLLSFSDLVICPKNGIKDFCRLCGAFAAVNLHVEMAIPTALAITYKKIVTEEDLKKHGKNGLQNHKNTEIKNMNNIASLVKDNILFIHPVKLSKCRIWKDYDNRTCIKIFGKAELEYVSNDNEKRI